jgi:SAM-dependent methyltransferase
MPDTFDVNQYWLARGQSYVKEGRLYGRYHRLQEQFIVEIIRHSGIATDRILELGCGFGRVTRLLAEQFPQSQITALDLSLDQLENARKHCQDKSNITFGTYDFYSGAPLPGNGYDLAIAIEVFLHHPAEIVSRLMAKLARTATCILNVDWSEPWPWNTPEHVWVHGYQRLYSQTGLQTATFVLPEKVDRKQQKLFVAGRALPSEVLALERQMSRPDPHAADPPEDWLQNLHRAELDVKTLIPRGSTCILVDENHWGASRNTLQSVMLPFLERNGEYWGLPPDDETAIRELGRMRDAGAEYVIFPWHSFWWLDHYAHFAQHLRSAFPCLVENEHLIVFKLK